MQELALEMHELPHALLVEHILQQEEEEPPPPGQPVRFSKNSIPNAKGISNLILNFQKRCISINSNLINYYWFLVKSRFILALIHRQRCS